ncbi:MAG: zinc ABC transporter substrate-binding protein, partial [Acidimicrobiia bacterium]
EAARNSGAKAVFSDPESGRAIMEQVARESGTVVEILDPIEVPDPDRDYDSRMRSNLQKIANALGCQESARVK